MIQRCKNFLVTKKMQPVALWARIVSLIILLGIVSASLSAQVPTRPDQMPAQLDDVSLVEKLNGQIDLDLAFTDDTGKTVTLREFFSKGRPVVLNLVYYSCPMLCGMVLQGVVKSLKQVPYTPGQDIEVVTISFDTRETPVLAAAKKNSIMQEYARPGAETGWHVLVDKDGNAKKLADQVGFKYKWDEDTKQFAHPSVTMILTAEGKLSRYLPGIDYAQRDMRLALAEASKGKIGSLSDRFMLYCYKYDPSSRSYVMAATNTMKLGGVLIVLLLGSALVHFWRRELNGQGKRRNPWEEEEKPD